MLPATWVESTAKSDESRRAASPADTEIVPSPYRLIVIACVEIVPPLPELFAEIQENALQCTKHTTAFLVNEIANISR